MADLYIRLEEIQGMTRVLGRDVERIRTRLGARSVQAVLSQAAEGNRRFYVRGVFALVEAVVEQHKRLLIDLASRGTINLEAAVISVLSEEVFIVKDNGTVSSRGQYLQLQRKIRALYRAAGNGFGEQLRVDYGDGGWETFQKAVEIRDRMTHPKTFDDCHIDDDDLDTVDKGHNWFRGVNSGFVRLARQHRTNRQW